MPQNKPKTMLSILRSIFATPKAPTLSELAEGTCALPAPKVMVKVPNAEKLPDAYLERKETNTWAFNSSKAIQHNEGSVPELTVFDVTLLEEQGFWGKSKQVRIQNEKCKLHWHNGDAAPAVALKLGLSESWVNKRFWIFGAALSAEKAVK